MLVFRTISPRSSLPYRIRTPLDSPKVSVHLLMEYSSPLASGNIDPDKTGFFISRKNSYIILMKLYMVPIALQTIFTSAVLVANILIGLYVFVQNTRNLVHRAFFLFTSGIACYGVGLILLVFTKNFIFNNIVFYGGLFVFLGLVFLAKVFPDKTTVEKTFWLHFIPCFFIFIALPFNVIVKGLALNATGSITPILGPLFPAFAAIIAYYVVLILFLFIRNYRRAFGLPRLQMQYLFFGASVFIVSMFSFNVILPAFGIFGFNL